MNDIYPLTIVKDRYNGTYSGGKWTAWNIDFSEVSKAINGDDAVCANLCAIYNGVYGRGNTPQEAIDDLKFVINYGKHITMKCIKEVNNADEDIATAFQIGLLFGKADKAIEEVEEVKKSITPQPCEDCVSRQAVEDAIAETVVNGESLGYAVAQEILSDLPPVSPQPKNGRCKDCKYFEYDSVAKVDGIPLIVAHEICSRWGDGCKTKEDGYCFLFEPKTQEVEK